MCVCVHEVFGSFNPCFFRIPEAQSGSILSIQKKPQRVNIVFVNVVIVILKKFLV